VFLKKNFWQNWGLTQGLTLARQVQHHLSHTSSPFCFSLFFREGVAFAWGWPQALILLPLLPTWLGSQVYAKKPNLFYQIGSHFFFAWTGLELRSASCIAGIVAVEMGFCYTAQNWTGNPPVSTSCVLGLQVYATIYPEKNWYLCPLFEKNHITLNCQNTLCPSVF
jgi:hypothetical protein